MLVRAEGRQQELAVRAAPGAGWGRLARQMLLEGVTLALLAGVLGLALAFTGVRLLVSAGPTGLPRLGEITMEPTVLAFAFFVSLLSGVVFGLVPVARYAGSGVARDLQSGGRTSSQSKGRHRVRNTLVVVQVSLALILLVASGLMLRTFQALRSIDPGFSGPEHVQLVRLGIPATQIGDPKQVLRTQNAIRDRIASLPGVSAVSFTSSAPMEPGSIDDLLIVEGEIYADGILRNGSSQRS